MRALSDFHPEQDGIDLAPTSADDQHQSPQQKCESNVQSLTRGLSWQSASLVKPSRQESSTEFAQQCRQTIGKE